MTREELLKKLIEENVPPRDYSINGPGLDDCFCTEYIRGKWQVYYVEKGSKDIYANYDNEEDACDHLYRLVYKYVIDTDWHREHNKK